MNDAHAEIRKAVVEARDFPRNTCPSSRHTEQIGEHLVTGTPYPMLADEGPYCGESILYTVKSLYEARTKIAALLAERDALEADAKRYRVLKDLRSQGLVSVAMFSDYEDMEAGLDAIAASGAGKEGGK